MKALASLKAKVQEDYQSKFDFDKYEIEGSDKEIIIRNEATIFRNYRTAADALYKVCKAIYENQLKFMKAEGSFMEWYTGIGFTKDKISELLKRNELYMNLEDKKEWVTSLPINAVKMLTHKSVEIELVLDAAELGLGTTSEIKIFLDARKNEGNVIDLIEVEKPKSTLLQAKNRCINYNNFEKLKKNISNMNSEEIVQTEKEIESLERYLKELKKSVQDRNKTFENKDNLKLVGVADEEIK
ncbi:MAG: hypothetical protein ACRCY7_07630 [Cetobacterium sp.]|uniref:hypothetical protein n=1 Tax=Cetobacterium sp. TaxID=2071632 RepID=UPI003F31A0EB